MADIPSPSTVSLPVPIPSVMDQKAPVTQHAGKILSMARPYG